MQRVRHYQTACIVIAFAVTACSERETSAQAVPATASSISQTIESAPIRSFTCPHQEQRPIFFTSKGHEDTLDIRIVGETCDSPDIEIRIVKPDGSVVHQTTAPAFSYIYDGRGPSALEYMVKTLDGSQYYSKALETLDHLTEENGFYDVDASAVLGAQRLNLPLFCHKAGKSFRNCFAYLNGKSVLVFSSGS